MYEKIVYSIFSHYLFWSPVPLSFAHMWGLILILLCALILTQSENTLFWEVIPIQSTLSFVNRKDLNPDDGGKAGGTEPGLQHLHSGSQ